MTFEKIIILLKLVDFPRQWLIYARNIKLNAERFMVLLNSYQIICQVCFNISLFIGQTFITRALKRRQILHHLTDLVIDTRHEELWIEAC